MAVYFTINKYRFTPPGPAFADSKDVKFDWEKIYDNQVNLNDYPVGHEVMGLGLRFDYTGQSGYQPFQPFDINFSSYNNDTGRLLWSGSVYCPGPDPGQYWLWQGAWFCIGSCSWELDRAMTVKMVLSANKERSLIAGDLIKLKSPQEGCLYARINQVNIDSQGNIWQYGCVGLVNNSLTGFHWWAAGGAWGVNPGNVEYRVVLSADQHTLSPAPAGIYEELFQTVTDSRKKRIQVDTLVKNTGYVDHNFAVGVSVGTNSAGTWYDQGYFVDGGGNFGYTGNLPIGQQATVRRILEVPYSAYVKDVKVSARKNDASWPPLAAVLKENAITYPLSIFALREQAAAGSV